MNAHIFLVSLPFYTIPLYLGCFYPKYSHAVVIYSSSNSSFFHSFASYAKRVNASVLHDSSFFALWIIEKRRILNITFTRNILQTDFSWIRPPISQKQCRLLWKMHVNLIEIDATTKHFLSAHYMDIRDIWYTRRNGGIGLFHHERIPEGDCFATHVQLYNGIEYKGIALSKITFGIGVELLLMGGFRWYYSFISWVCEKFTNFYIQVSVAIISMTWFHSRSDLVWTILCDGFTMNTVEYPHKKRSYLGEFITKLESSWLLIEDATPKFINRPFLILLVTEIWNF